MGKLSSDLSGWSSRSTSSSSATPPSSARHILITLAISSAVRSFSASSRLTLASLDDAPPRARTCRLGTSSCLGADSTICSESMYLSMKDLIDSGVEQTTAFSCRARCSLWQSAMMPSNRFIASLERSKEKV